MIKPMQAVIASSLLAPQQQGQPELLAVRNLPVDVCPRRLTATACKDSLAAELTAMFHSLIPPSTRGEALQAFIVKLTDDLHETGFDVAALMRCLDKAMHRDRWATLAQGLVDGMAIAGTTLALNLAGNNALLELTGSDIGTAAIAGSLLGAFSVVGGHVVRPFFDDAWYMRADGRGCAETLAGITAAAWSPQDVSLLAFVDVIVTPPTLRNVVRAWAKCALAWMGYAQLTPHVDSMLEIGGGLVASAATSAQLQRQRQYSGFVHPAHVLTHEHAVEALRLLRDDEASIGRGIFARARHGALEALRQLPAGLRLLATPCGISQVLALTVGIAITNELVQQVGAVTEEYPTGTREAATGLAHIGALAGVYALLALSARHADNAMHRVAHSFKRIGCPAPRDSLDHV
jgi:hypothetical protein